MYLFTWKSYFYQHFAVLNKMDFKVRVGAAIFKIMVFVITLF